MVRGLRRLHMQPSGAECCTVLVFLPFPVATCQSFCFLKSPIHWLRTILHFDTKCTERRTFQICTSQALTSLSFFGDVHSRGIGTLISQLKEAQEGPKGPADWIVPRMLRLVKLELQSYQSTSIHYWLIRW
jgi:hypothetical protein